LISDVTPGVQRPLRAYVEFDENLMMVGDGLKHAKNNALDSAVELMIC
jgi:hypothetical protein